MYRPAKNRQQGHCLDNFTLRELGVVLGGVLPRPKALESTWLCSCALSKEQGTAIIRIHTSCIIFEPCKTQGPSMQLRDGSIDKSLYPQKCQLLAIAGVGQASRTSSEEYSDPGTRHKAPFLQSRYCGESFPCSVFPKHCSEEGKMPLLLTGYPTGSCASFAVALGEFLSIGECLKYLNTFVKLGLHFPGFPASVFYIVFLDCKCFRARSLFYYVQHLAPQSPLDNVIKSPATYHQGQRWTLNQRSSH